MRGAGLDDGSAARRGRPAHPPGDGEAAASAVEDRGLIERSRFGDQEAFGALVRKYQERAIAIARNFVLTEEAARDVAQEGFLRVYRNLHRYDPERHFYTWFYSIVVHLSIDWTRRRCRVRELLRQRAKEPFAHPEDPSRPLERQDLREQVESVLAELPVKYRLLLVLRDVEGFTAKEIAEISGSNHATVRWRLHRARKIFRDAWEAAGHEPVATGRADGTMESAGRDAGGEDR